ncbi:ATP-binding protein [Amycolatopsis sp.]|uniref:ATP-binding protein n=1 Tax=Amycolatopsis sp. TaxID=37632 RepID=UPI002605236A|nr:ATP-binding protein [Amycolatopsis sp.]
MPAQRRYLKSKVEITAAMLDRLLHRATVVGIDGPSYRLRSHQSTSDKLRKAVNARVS